MGDDQITSQSWSRQILLRLVAILVVLLVSLALIKLIDVVLPRSGAHDFLFPPGSQVRYLSAEFDAIAKINDFGFRGDETQLRRGQIIAVGDSFTFGFGNNYETTWPVKLEKKLRDSDLRLEVYNLGVPGTDTLFHIETALNYVETLEPRYLILAVLLSDDFQQVNERVDLPLKYKAEAIIKTAFPTLSGHYKGLRYAKRARKKRDEDVIEVTKNWQRDSSSYLAADNEGETYPADVVDRIKNGDINPGLLYLARNFPERGMSFWSNLSEGRPREVSTYEKIERELSSLQERLKRQSGELIVLSMPGGAFVESEVFYNYKKYGFALSSVELTTLEPEQYLRELSDRVGAHFVPSLTHARGLEGEFFFPYDGHLTESGNAMVADLLFEFFRGR